MKSLYLTFTIDHTVNENGVFFTKILNNIYDYMNLTSSNKNYL
jgi:hypothetical protein